MRLKQPPREILSWEFRPSSGQEGGGRVGRQTLGHCSRNFPVCQWLPGEAGSSGMGMRKKLPFGGNIFFFITQVQVSYKNMSLGYSVITDEYISFSLTILTNNDI